MEADHAPESQDCAWITGNSEVSTRTKERCSQRQPPITVVNRRGCWKRNQSSNFCEFQRLLRTKIQ